MPLYEVTCDAHGRQEVLSNVTTVATLPCPTCGESSRRSLVYRVHPIGPIWDNSHRFNRIVGAPKRGFRSAKQLAQFEGSHEIVVPGSQRQLIEADHVEQGAHDMVTDLGFADIGAYDAYLTHARALGERMPSEAPPCAPGAKAVG